jgi:hypothetical protein
MKTRHKGTQQITRMNNSKVTIFFFLITGGGTDLTLKWFKPVKQRLQFS